MTKNSILVVGSSNTDMIIKVERIPKPGETILGGEFASAAGGKGANQAVGAARAGGAVTFIARVGQDMFGDKAVAGFVADGINVDYVVRDRTCPSGVALIFVGENGENSIAVASGANAKLTPADMRKAKGAFGRSSVVVLQLETPLETVEAAAKLAAAAGARVILNPAPARPLPDDLLKRVYLLTPNESEAELLTGVAVNNEAAAAKAADALLARGVQNVIITLGARGAFVAGRQARNLVKGFKVSQWIPPGPVTFSMARSPWRWRKANRCWRPPVLPVPPRRSRSPVWAPRLRLHRRDEIDQLLTNG